MATIDTETRRKANLRVLQRIDPNIVDLAITATHVVLYEFNDTERTWEKKHVEGSLFVTKRSDSPRFKLIVLNRSSMNNLEVAITESFQMQVKEPYMIFRDSSTSKAGTDETIRGIWFYDGKERDQIASYLEQVMKSLVKIEEIKQDHSPKQALASKDEDIACQDAGAALLSTLTFGSNYDESASRPEQILGKQTAAPPSSTQKSLVLDKKSLQLSLLSLLQDERFLDLIHAQYLKVVHTRAARQQKSKLKESDSQN